MAQAVGRMAVLLGDSLVAVQVQVQVQVLLTKKVLRLRKWIRLACKGRTV